MMKLFAAPSPSIVIDERASILELLYSELFWPIVIVAAFLVVLIVYGVCIGNKRDIGRSAGDMVGERGTALDRIISDGKITVKGEIWSARSQSGIIESGDQVEVVAMHPGMVLEVIKIKG